MKTMILLLFFIGATGCVYSQDSDRISLADLMAALAQEDLQSDEYWMGSEIRKQQCEADSIERLQSPVAYFELGQIKIHFNEELRPFGVSEGADYVAVLLSTEDDIVVLTIDDSAQFSFEQLNQLARIDNLLLSDHNNKLLPLAMVFDQGNNILYEGNEFEYVLLVKNQADAIGRYRNGQYHLFIPIQESVHFYDVVVSSDSNFGCGAISYDRLDGAPKFEWSDSISNFFSIYLRTGLVNRDLVESHVPDSQ